METGEKNESFWVADIKNTWLLRGLIKFKTFLKVEYEGKLWISESNLFHSSNADGEKKIKEKVILYFKVACMVDIKLFSYGLILL